MRTIAPAKINWTLEVLGRREDGYHEIRSVMQTIDLCDEVSADSAPSSTFETTGGDPLADDDLVVRASRALEARVGRTLPARVRVEKRIPVGSGLGGGSSDAAAVLRLLNALHAVHLSNEDLALVGAEIGSDVPFFVFGGTALVEGRGEKVTRLPDARETWVVLLVPPTAPTPKTAAMYASLADDDFSNGSRTQETVEAIENGKVVDDWSISNAFERAALACFHDLDAYRYALLSAGARAVYLAGSGPGLFVLGNGREAAAEIAGRVKAGGGTVIVAKTLGAVMATAVSD